MSGQTYEDLIAKISELQQQAEAVRKSELDTVVADIKVKIKKYNLSAADLGLGGNLRRAGRVTTAVKVKIAPGKYRNPETGEVKEVGAAGRKPTWLTSLSADELERARVN